MNEKIERIPLREGEGEGEDENENGVGSYVRIGRLRHDGARDHARTTSEHELLGRLRLDGELIVTEHESM